jgi:hypothetical protein
MSKSGQSLPEETTPQGEVASEEQRLATSVVPSGLLVRLTNDEEEGRPEKQGSSVDCLFNTLDSRELPAGLSIAKMHLKARNSTSKQL